MPRVTVAIAVYNGAETLGAAIESVLLQSFVDYDILVLDDGSTDRTANLAQLYPVEYVYQENAGLGAARKRLVELAKGDWIAFLDHDDVWMPEKLELQMAAIKPGDVLVHTEGTYVYPEREVVREESFTDSSFAALLPNNRVLASSAVFDRRMMLAAGNFTADTVRCSDWYGWMLIAGKGTFRHVPENLILYHVLESSLANSGYKFFDARRHIIENHFLKHFNSFFGSVKSKAQRWYYRQLLRQELGLSLSGMASSLKKEGDREAAAKLARTALRAAPDVAKVVSRASGVLLGP